MSRPICTINPYTLEKQFRNKGGEQESSRKILIVTYYWPPCGGAGVQRWLKFSKYLPEMGWEPYVVTVDPNNATFPATDRSLEAEVHPSVKVYRTKAINWFLFFNRSVPSQSGKKSATAEKLNTNHATTPQRLLVSRISRFIRGNFFIPDPRRGWNRHAVRMASKLIREEGIRYVVTTSPPHSTQLIGLKLKRRFPHIQWIADLRDPWTDIFYYDMFYPTALSRALDRSMEKSVLREADLVTTAGYFLDGAKSKQYNLDPDKIMPLLNGFDEDDFNKSAPEKATIFTITYAGSISDRYPVESFIRATLETVNAGREISVRFIGSSDATIKEVFIKGLPAGTVEFLSYVDHPEIIKRMMGSQMLLLIIPDHKKNKTIIPGKLFEYIRSGNPVLSIGPPDSDVAKILKQTAAGRNFIPDDWEGMYNYITSTMKNQPYEATNTIELYNRKNQLTELINRLEG